jgi:hypothetical protein
VLCLEIQLSHVFVSNTVRFSSGGLSVTGPSTLADSLRVGGSATLSGPTAVGGTLSVAGAAALAGSLSVTAGATLGALAVSGGGAAGPAATIVDVLAPAASFSGVALKLRTVATPSSSFLLLDTLVSGVGSVFSVDGLGKLTSGEPPAWCCVGAGRPPGRVPALLVLRC